MHLGLDFGTTNSTAAVYDGTNVQFIPLDPAAPNPAVMRSAAFMGRKGELLVGQAAIDHYTASNVGREIVYERRYIGETELTLADVGTVVQGLYAVVDANAPGRLFQSLKTVLRDSSYTSTDVYGTRWKVEELVATLLVAIRQRVEEHIGERITSVTLGRPVRYVETAEGDALAVERMRCACELAGLPEVSFLPEPVAAGFAYARDVADRRHVLVFDFGGGTLDVTVVAIDARGKREALATGGVPIGGDLLDSRVVMGALLPYFGAGAVLGPRRLPLPAFLLDGLESWQSILELHTPRTLNVIEEAIATSNRPAELRALRSLIRENYGLLLYAEVERAKCRISSLPQDEIVMEFGAIHFRHPLTRVEFERLIGPEARAIAGCVDEVLDQAGLWPDQIDVVLRTGGSSRIPRFIRLLSDRFGSDRLREQDPFTSVGAGLAVAAWERHQRRSAVSHA